MTGINALSTRGAITSTEDGSPFTSGSQSGADSAAMMFAAIFGGWLNQVGGQGQDSGNQSQEPAGKDANSGRHALLGLDGLQGLMGILQGNEGFQEVFVQGLQGEGEQGVNSEQLKTLMTQLDALRNQALPANYSSGILEDVQLSGMTEQPQGKIFPQSELDLYKNVISNLLKEMSGEMKLKPQNQAEANPLAQQKSELAAQRYNSGLFITMDGEGQEPSVMATQAKTDAAPMNTVPTDMTLTDTAKTAANTFVQVNQGTLLAALLGKSKSDPDGTGSDETGLDENQVKPGVGNGPEGRTAKNPEILSLNQENSEDNMLLKQEAAKSTASPHSALEEKLAESGLVSAKGTVAKGLQDDEQPIETNKGNKSILPDVAAGNLTHQAKDIAQVQGKVADKGDQPIWTQVARDIFDKAYLARPQLRELTIQLHPAHLGAINIAMNWDEGQVHLRIVASDGGTGQLLQQNLSELRDSLTQLGIQCGQMEMGLGEQKEGAQEHQGREGSGHSQESGDDVLESLNSEELERILSNDEVIPGASRINIKA
ncbi:flagellar hook-length control protein [Desulfitobacterium hafniense DCB-2]|uniref:Flagellar hook-length control protein n=1 Tax=Desulfitobacterium hafniense (strain DSM 10664 / DCB-2) TaxID=272564 RepID=B8FTP3_DESHD|nr:flagellar hook-length control protein FliK [Desulfitobacterium hafniense]ACL22135.1 flagellar hook-length control protein [Desulfitobacterium hafniense DCB-2]